MGVVLKRLAHELRPLHHQHLEPPCHPGPIVSLTWACKHQGPRLGSLLMWFK